MSMTLNIPDDIVAAIKWPRHPLARQLLVEMAFALYGRGLASMGSPRRLAALDNGSFLEGLAERHIERHYGENELAEDIDYVNTSSQ